MPRPKGSRDREYESRRHALLSLARAHLSSPSGRNASWRELAESCGVSVPTMNHYFNNRAELVTAILSNAHEEGAPYLASASRPAGPFAESVLSLVTMLSRGLQHGVLALQVIGLSEGFANQDIGDAYLGHHLEPIVNAISARLRGHIETGEMRDCDPRFAAISLLSPLLIAHLHQTTLGGSADYPITMADFIAQHADSFTRAHAAARSPAS